MAHAGSLATPVVAKSIPLSSVRDALMFNRVRGHCARTGGPVLARCAAFTQHPNLTPMACRDSLRWPSSVRPRRLEIVGHFGPMYAGDLTAVLERVRREHGAAEVRRTWGVGMRALQRDFTNGVMR